MILRVYPASTDSYPGRSSSAELKSDQTAGDVLVDCDVHPSPPAERIASFLPERWQRYYRAFGRGGRLGSSSGYTRPRAHAAITNSWPPSGGQPGSDLDFMAAQLLDAWHHTYAVLQPLASASSSGEYGAALAAAMNQAVLSDWVERDPRLYASLSVAYEEPDLAVKEIERLGNHPRVVQILVLCRTRDPLGDRKYWPIYEAAVAADLPIAMHVSGFSSYPLTACGWPSYYFEDHNDFQQCFQDQVISLVASGVFVRFPRLKIVLVEAGFSWMLPVMWRLDRSYGLLREYIPPLEKPPSDYCREHFWFTTQPMEEPENPAHVLQVMEQLRMDDRYLFSTDYPHWDFDAPDRALPKGLRPEQRRAILGENALSLYTKLPDPRARSAAA
jgi:uncharacterized protein